MRQHADDKLRVVVDVGSDVGISALCFMTRKDESRCYLFEPDPRNVETPKRNLPGYGPRHVLRPEVVSDIGGSFQFGIESTDLYPANEVLQEIVGDATTIDVPKIDTEGVALRTVKTVDEELLKRIGKVYLESNPGEAAPGRVRAAPVRQRLLTDGQGLVRLARTLNWLQQ